MQPVRYPQYPCTSPPAGFAAVWDGNARTDGQDETGRREQHRERRVVASCREPSSAMRVAAEERTGVLSAYRTLSPVVWCMLHAACVVSPCADVQRRPRRGLEHSSGHALPLLHGYHGVPQVLVRHSTVRRSRRGKNAQWQGRTNIDQRRLVVRVNRQRRSPAPQCAVLAHSVQRSYGTVETPMPRSITGASTRAPHSAMRRPGMRRCERHHGSGQVHGCCCLAQ